MADMARITPSPNADFNIQISGRHIDLGEAFRIKAEEGLRAAIDKYFDRAGSKGGSGEVRVSRDGPLICVDITLLMGIGQQLVAKAAAGDAHAALDAALDKLAKQARRYHRELTSHKPHNGGARGPADRAPLSEATAAIDGEDDDSDVTEEWGADGSAGAGKPRGAIIAETVGAIRPMTVAMAAMELEARGEGAIAFKNTGSGAVAVVYMRPDGNIGWFEAPAAEPQPGAPRKVAGKAGAEAAA